MDTNNNQNNKLFIFGIVCLVLCITFILFSLYIIPFLIWNLNYNVSAFVITLIAYFEDTYYFSEPVSRFIVWLILFIPGLIAGYLSYLISHKIDNKVLGLEPYTEETEEEVVQRTERIKKDLKESAGIGLKILFLMIASVAVFLLLQLVI